MALFDKKTHWLRFIQDPGLHFWLPILFNSTIYLKICHLHPTSQVLLFIYIFFYFLLSCVCFSVYVHQYYISVRFKTIRNFCDYITKGIFDFWFLIHLFNKVHCFILSVMNIWNLIITTSYQNKCISLS